MYEAMGPRARGVCSSRLAPSRNSPATRTTAAESVSRSGPSAAAVESGVRIRRTMNGTTTHNPADTNTRGRNPTASARSPPTDTPMIVETVPPTEFIELATRRSSPRTSLGVTVPAVTRKNRFPDSTTSAPA